MILIADDDADIRRLLSARLVSEGFETSEVANGKEAVRWLKENRADLVMLDLIMSGGSGQEVLTYRQTMGDPPPVIVISAMAEEWAVRRQADPTILHLSKPVNLDLLMIAVRRAVRVRV